MRVCLVRLLETLVEGRPFVGTSLFCGALETLVEDRPFVGVCLFGQASRDLD